MVSNFLKMNRGKPLYSSNKYIKNNKFDYNLNMNTLNIALRNLEWAASNIGMPLGDVVSKISGSPKTQSKILEGKLSVREAEKLSKLTKVPFGYLFLEEPPQLFQPEIPDLRQKMNPLPLSQEFKEVLKDVKAKQDWYVDFLKDLDAEPLSFVGKYNSSNEISHFEVAHSICQTLNLPINVSTRRARETYFSTLVERCEAQRILVFRSGVVGSNNRSLDINEFRGFVLTNRFSPAIFINLQDSPSARIFTLAHELAHIWLGQSGVDDLDIYGNNKIEVFCNKVAAEVLVPQKVFLEQWKIFDKNISKISDYFGVSELVIARIALTLSKISKEEYYEKYQFIKNYELRKIRESKGGDYYRTILNKNTLPLSRAVFNKAMSGGITLREASKILGMNPQSVMRLGELIST